MNRRRGPAEALLITGRRRRFNQETKLALWLNRPNLWQDKWRKWLEGEMQVIPPAIFPPLSAIPPYSGNKTHHSTFPEALDVGSNRHQRRLRFLFWVAPSEPMAVQPLPASGPASSVPVFRNWSSGTREPITALTGLRGHSIPTSAVSASSCRQRYFHSIDWIITTTASIRIAVWVSSDPISSADTAGAKRNESVRTPFQLFSVLILRNRTGTISRTASTSQRSGSV